MADYSEALETWRRRLAHLLNEEAAASDPGKRFTIREEIAEARKKIAELESAEQGKATAAGTGERLAAAVEQLADSSIMVRIAGVSALDSIARQSESDRPFIAEILCSFVRESSVATGPAPSDIQTTIRVLTDDRRQNQLYIEKRDLHGANLRGAHLRGANLTGANLSEADLTGAYLSEANVSNANLTNATLWSVDFVGANLQGAHLDGLDLRGANLRGAVRTSTARIFPTQNEDGCRLEMPPVRGHRSPAPRASRSPTASP